MAKRTATKELTHENWEVEEEHEEMGKFRQATTEEMAGRSIKKARRRGTNGDSSSPSVFKGLSVFSSFKSTSDSPAPPTFSFLGSVSKDSSGCNTSKTNSNAKIDAPLEKTSQPLKVTQDSFSSVKGSDTKSNGFLESKDSSEGSGKADSFFLSSLKSLNEGVLVWIQKHLDKNPHVNLTPVFDDYKKHFSELLKKYPPEVGHGKESDMAPLAQSSKKDVASGKENTPVSKDDLVKESSPVKPFSFGHQTTASSTNKTSEPHSKSLFTFGSSASETGSSTTTTTTTTLGSTPNFSFTSESSLFGNSNSSSGVMFGGLNSAKTTNASNVGFSFSSGSSITTTTEKKDDGEKVDDPSDEPPKVEVNEVKEEDALYEKKCKLFYMKEGAYVDRGVGTLYLKAAGEKTQLLVRAYTNLGNILLNIVLNNSLPTARAGKNGVLIVCVPNPPLETNAEKSKEPVKMLIRVKTSEDADNLLEKINEYKK